MAFALVDDALPDNPKIKPLSDGAWRLYVTSIIYCARNLTDGHIDPRTVRELALGRRRIIQELVDADLFHENGNGYEVHDYLDHNPTAEEVKKKRAEAAERMRKLRANATRKR